MGKPHVIHEKENSRLLIKCDMFHYAKRASAISASANARLHLVSVDMLYSVNTETKKKKDKK